MSHGGRVVSRRRWIWLASLAVTFLVFEPPASAVDAPSRERVLPTLHVKAPQAGPAVHMTSFFPNPSPKVQAVGTPQQVRDDRGTDRNAYLQNATPLTLEGDGYRVLGPGMERYYGTYELVELIQQTGARFAERHGSNPQAYFLVGDLSKRRGGTIRDRSGRRVHSSHRNGLDVDINYVRKQCGTGSSDQDPKGPYGPLNNPNCRLHLRENMELLRDFVRGGPGGSSLVSRIFVSDGFVHKACRAARERPRFRRRYRRVMSHMKAMPGHQAHFHLRLKCPDNSLRCYDANVKPRSPCGGRK